jgi:hypothetical protein
MTEVNLTIARARIEKAAISGSMDMKEQIELFSGIDELLKSHAKKKWPALSSEGAFVKELGADEAFRAVVQKTRALQEDLNASP